MNTLKIEQRDHVLRIIFQRVEQHNALNAEMIEEITRAFVDANSNPTCRVVFVKGAGASFCAGADLHWMKESARFSEDQNKADALKLFDMFSAIRACKWPVVMKVHGNAMGGALGLIAAADIVAAENDTAFCFSEVRLGLVPAVISSFVAAKASQGFMCEHMLTAKKFKAEQALAAGLVHRCGRELEINDYLAKTLQGFAELAPEAVVQTKALLHDLTHLRGPEVRDHTASLIASKRVGAEGQEGLAAFFEKRKPNWVIEQK